MKEAARQILLKTLHEHHDLVLQNRACCIGLLKDYGGNHHPEVTILADCVEHRIARRISELAREKIDLDTIMAIVEDFHVKSFYDTEMCCWAVESWAIGFDIKHPPVSCFQKNTKNTTAKTNQGSDLLLKSAEVSFDLKQGDLDAMNSYLKSRADSKKLWPIYLHVICAGIGFIVSCVAMLHWWSRIIGFFVTWALLFNTVTGILGFFDWIDALLAKRKSRNGVISHNTIKISKTEISARTPLESETCAWQAVSWFHCEGKHIFICVPSGIHIIPFSAFGTDLKRGLEFVDLTKCFFEFSRRDAKQETLDATQKVKKANPKSSPRRKKKASTTRP